VIEGLVGISSERSELVGPQINLEAFFQDSMRARDIPLLFVGPFNEAKGSQEIRRRWPNGEVRIVGPRTAEAEAYAGYVGPLPYSDVLSVMSRTKTFVFHPRWPEPFGRVVAEAALSGCTLDTNDRVGALSYGVDLGDRRFYEHAAQRFWLTVESLIT
jgi:glycosyltransferase involved in cell wall biosynthesis